MSELKQISGSVLYRSPDDWIDEPCLYAVVGGKRTLMVDGGVTPAIATEFVDAVRARTGRSVDYVLLTHWHWDHVFGLTSVDAPVIGHRDLTANLTRLKDIVRDDASLDAAVAEGRYTAHCAANIRKSYANCREIEIRMPDILFDGVLRFDLGGLICDAVALPGCHTDDTVAINVGAEQVLILGDAIYPVFDGIGYFHSAPATQALFRLVDGSGARWILDSHSEPMAAREFMDRAAPLRAAADGVMLGVTDKAELIGYIAAQCAGLPREEAEGVAELFLNGLRRQA